jgi:catechol 2,3-dioxygenase-like lactoylglutathione lyase family enzyme
MKAARGFALLFILLALQARAAEPHVSAVGPIGVTVSDLDRSVAFYTEVLGFEKRGEKEVLGPDYERLAGVFGMRARIATLALGTETIELTEYLAPRGRAMPPDSRGNDRWFQHIAIVTSDLDRAYALLREHHVEHASTGPQRLPDWNPAAGGIQAFYFRDPDGHFLELIQFPKGKGDPRWHGGRLAESADVQRAQVSRSEPKASEDHRVGEQRRAPAKVERASLFLGIDHTAIVVADTDASLHFYRDLLGLRVAGTSENWGPEQERLNGVFGARLRITTLRAEHGPGVELLEYRTPRDGRPRPSDARSNDLLHWQTDLVADAPLAPLAERLFDARTAFVSPGTTELPDASLGFRQAMLVSDPDGHALRIRAEQEH